MNQGNFDVIIIGGGIGGAASALRAAQNNLNTLWVLGSKQTRRRSRSQWVVNVDNMIGYHEDVVKKPILKQLIKNGYETAANSILNTHFPVHNRAIIQNTRDRLTEDYPNVVQLETEAASIKSKDGFMIATGMGQYHADSVVLATGVMDEQPHIFKSNKKGETEWSSKWIYPFANKEQVLYCIRCEGHLTRSSQVAVIGNKEPAAELALMLHERYGNKVFLLLNGADLQISEKRAEAIQAYGLEIIPDAITDLLSETPKNLRGFVFSSHSAVHVDFALAALGIHRVYNDLARQVGAELAEPELPDEKRHILIDWRGETTVPNLFVVGDAARRRDEQIMKQIYTAQEYAVRAVDAIDLRRRLKQRAQAVQSVS